MNFNQFQNYVYNNCNIYEIDSRQMVDPVTKNPIVVEQYGFKVLVESMILDDGATQEKLEIEDLLTRKLIQLLHNYTTQDSIIAIRKYPKFSSETGYNRRFDDIDRGCISVRFRLGSDSKEFCDALKFLHYMEGSSAICCSTLDEVRQLLCPQLVKK